MNNLITLLQELFMGKDNNTAKIGLTYFRNSNQKNIKKKKAPQELKLSELMKKGGC